MRTTLGFSLLVNKTMPEQAVAPAVPRIVRSSRSPHLTIGSPRAADSTATRRAVGENALRARGEG